MDAQQRMFGTERLEEALRDAGPPQSALQLTTEVRAAVDGFSAGAEQYDDLTLLGFRRTV
jgi:serine phosphatase RsbU (regulator of sigma subunit)